MNPQKKSTTRQQTDEQQQIQQDQQAKQAAAAQEFASVEELLRHDSLNTTVPPAIAQRLQESLNQLPPAPRPAWWRRILGGPGL